MIFDFIKHKIELIEFKIEKNVLICYKGNKEMLIIPDNITSIGHRAFADYKKLISIQLPNSLSFIGDEAFWGCSNLTSVQFSDSLTKIGNKAFYDCNNLTNIQFPNSLSFIGDEAFWGCSNLTNIQLSNSLTEIGDEAFRYCENLTKIKFSNSLTKIGNNAFRYCSKLTNIQLPNNLSFIGDEAFIHCKNLTIYGYANSYAQKYAMQNGIPFVVISENKSKSITYIKKENDFEIDNRVLIRYKGHNETVIVPDGIISIDNKAFYNCKSLINIQLPDGITSIGNSTFAFCERLASIQFPNSLTSIGNSAFAFCERLTSIQFPNSLTSIGKQAFQYCSSLANIQLPNSLVSIGDLAFAYCNSVTNIQLPNSLTSIGYQAFNGYSSNLIIHGYANSYAQEYAKEHEIPFVVIGGEKTKNTSMKKEQKGIKLRLNAGNFLMLQQNNYVIENTYIHGNIVYLEDYFKINLENGVIENKCPNTSYQWQEIHSQRSGLIGAIANTLCMCVQIWKGVMPYQTQDVCNSLTAQMNLYLRQYGLTGKLTEHSWKFSYKNEPITFQEIFNIIPANAPLEESPREITELYIKEQWTLCNKTLHQSPEPSLISTLPDNTTFFYESAYVCPSCERKLNKILIQSDSHIYANGKEEPIRTVFSCKYCNEFFAQFQFNPLGSGKYFHLKVNKQRYNEIALSLDACGRQRQF